jgi:hypothetical protein
VVKISKGSLLSIMGGVGQLLDRELPPFAGWQLGRIGRELSAQVERWQKDRADLIEKFGVPMAPGKTDQLDTESEQWPAFAAAQQELAQELVEFPYTLKLGMLGDASVPAAAIAAMGELVEAVEGS